MPTVYRLPNFPLRCDIRDNVGGISPVGPVRLASVPCQLFVVRKATNLTPTAGVTLLLKLPRLTDIRGPHGSTGGDWVAIPAGAPPFYGVEWVADVAKGFPNEYRTAQLFLATGLIPSPQP